MLDGLIMVDLRHTSVPVLERYMENPERPHFETLTDQANRPSS